MQRWNVRVSSFRSCHFLLLSLHSWGRSQNRWSFRCAKLWQSSFSTYSCYPARPLCWAPAIPQLAWAKIFPPPGMRLPGVPTKAGRVKETRSVESLPKNPGRECVIQLLLVVVLVPRGAVVLWRLFRLRAVPFWLWGGGVGLILLIILVVLLFR